MIGIPSQAEGTSEILAVVKKIKSNQKVFEEILNDPDLVVQTVVAIHQMQCRAIRLRKSDTVLNGYDVVQPTVNDGFRAIENTGPQLRESIHVQRGSHQKHTAVMQQRR